MITPWYMMPAHVEAASICANPFIFSVVNHPLELRILWHGSVSFPFKSLCGAHYRQQSAADEYLRPVESSMG